MHSGCEPDRFNFPLINFHFSWVSPFLNYYKLNSVTKFLVKFIVENLPCSSLNVKTKWTV